MGNIDASKLHIISVISNPVRYKTRDRLFAEFVERQKNSKATQWIVEAVFGDREFTHAQCDHPNHIQLRCDHEVWVKEAMINAAVSRLPHDWEYVMWMDSDIQFVRPDWEHEIIHALQHYAVVQPFSHAIDLGPDYETLKVHTGFAHNYIEEGPESSTLSNASIDALDEGYPTPTKGKSPGGNHWHPGYAWAFRRSAWNAVGGMLDVAICGAGDNHMAHALIGKGATTCPTAIHENYRRAVMLWEDRAEKHIKRNIGYVPGTILHYFHGHKVNRNYQGRWKILTKNQYDPEVDIIKDWAGMPQLTDHNIQLRDDLRRYFRERKEDVIAG